MHGESGRSLPLVQHFGRNIDTRGMPDVVWEEFSLGADIKDQEFGWVSLLHQWVQLECTKTWGLGCQAKSCRLGGLCSAKNSIWNMKHNRILVWSTHFRYHASLYLVLYISIGTSSGHGIVHMPRNASVPFSHDSGLTHNSNAIAVKSSPAADLISQKANQSTPNKHGPSWRQFSFVREEMGARNMVQSCTSTHHTIYLQVSTE